MQDTSPKLDEVSKISKPLLSSFLAYLSWYMPRHFHALRVANAEKFPRDAHPLIVCINHPSWWDPLTILVLSRYLNPRRTAHAPMEAEALRHYGFFRRIGAFPVNNRSSRAGASFLRQAKIILTNPESILWMTPEGQFTDVRKQDAIWKHGTAALTRHLDVCTVVPVAIEYTFWDERLPEILCYVGEPLKFVKTNSERIEDRNSRLQSAMLSAQQELSSLAVQRNLGLFTSVFAGSTGISRPYDLWQRTRALLTGSAYVSEHRAIAPK